MQARTKPTVFRSRGTNAKGANFLLSAIDRQSIATLRSAFEERWGVSVSTSLILSLALEAMIAECRGGSLRTNAEFTTGRMRVLAGASK